MNKCNSHKDGRLCGRPVQGTLSSMYCDECVVDKYVKCVNDVINGVLYSREYEFSPKQIAAITRDGRITKVINPGVT